MSYEAHHALDPFFEIILRGLDGLVTGEHFYDTIADAAVFEFRYEFPGFARVVRGRAALIEAFSGYGDNIVLHSADELVVHRAEHVVTLEYDVHGTIVATGGAYDNRFASIITIDARQIVRWRDYMDSLAAWKALTHRAPDRSRS
ncbi:MAG TPA: nuclear transport factor 2 family protein [Kofleriaceae bacterium]|nr:nuclear transport factor 2 family protein [Kofleriaceae bacterium]